jgi:endonuclease G
MKKFLLALLLVPVLALANVIDEKCADKVAYGSPVPESKTGTYLCRLGYALYHDPIHKTPVFVVEHVTQAHLGTEPRTDAFVADPDLPKSEAAQLKDYAGNPYDRGHMSPAANNSWSKEAMNQSFFLSNMVPQVPNNNRGIWKQLEENVRSWVKAGADIYTIEGPIYDPGYKTIGPGKVGVPTRLYKIILDVKGGRAIAFLMPNSELPVKDLPKFAVSIATVEKETGIKFFPGIPAAQQHLITGAPNLSQWTLK